MVSPKLKHIRLLHLLVDLCEIIGGGLVADYMFRIYEKLGNFASHHPWVFGLTGCIVILMGLVLDRRNALAEV